MNCFSNSFYFSNHYGFTWQGSRIVSSLKFLIFSTVKQLTHKFFNSIVTDLVAMPSEFFFFETTVDPIEFTKAQN